MNIRPFDQLQINKQPLWSRGLWSAAINARSLVVSRLPRPPSRLNGREGSLEPLARSHLNLHRACSRSRFARSDWPLSQTSAMRLDSSAARTLRLGPIP